MRLLVLRLLVLSSLLYRALISGFLVVSKINLFNNDFPAITGLALLILPGKGPEVSLHNCFFAFEVIP